MKKIICPINPRTKEKFECRDCKLREACIEDICSDYEKYVIKGAARLGRRITKVLKERRGI